MTTWLIRLAGAGICVMGGSLNPGADIREAPECFLPGLRVHGLDDHVLGQVHGHPVVGNPGVLAGLLPEHPQVLGRVAEAALLEPLAVLALRAGDHLDVGRPERAAGMICRAHGGSQTSSPWASRMWRSIASLIPARVRGSGPDGKMTWPHGLSGGGSSSTRPHGGRDSPAGARQVMASGSVDSGQFRVPSYTRSELLMGAA